MDLTNICLHIFFNEHNFLLKNHINSSLTLLRNNFPFCAFVLHCHQLFSICAINFNFNLNIKAGSNFLLVPNFSSSKLWNIKANLFSSSCQTFQTWTKILEVVLKLYKLLHCCTDNLDSALISPNFTGSWSMLLKNCGPSWESENPKGQSEN